jgi:hypothetical protein
VEQDITGHTKHIYPTIVSVMHLYRCLLTFDPDDTFFKYNDEQVTEVPSSEVLQDRTGSDANPALLCYVRRGGSLIDTLHREVLQGNVSEGELIGL